MNVVLADLLSRDHQAAIVELLDMYCRDEFGDSQPLADEARQNLIPGLVDHGGACVFLAYEGEQPAGVAICLLGFSTFKALPILNVHDLAVAPRFRGRGIGRALLAAVEAHAREAGCGKLTLEVRADNALAQEVYCRAGFAGSEPETLFWSKRL